MDKILLMRGFSACCRCILPTHALARSGRLRMVTSMAANCLRRRSYTTADLHIFAFLRLGDIICLNARLSKRSWLWRLRERLASTSSLRNACITVSLCIFFVWPTCRFIVQRKFLVVCLFLFESVASVFFCRHFACDNKISHHSLTLTGTSAKDISELNIRTDCIWGDSTPTAIRYHVVGCLVTIRSARYLVETPQPDFLFVTQLDSQLGK